MPLYSPSNGGSASVTAPLNLPAGTTTTSNPIITGTQTWNGAGIAFTGFKINITDTASSATSLLFDYQVGGVSKIRGDKNGTLIGQTLQVAAGVGYWNASALGMGSSTVVGWASGGDASLSKDTGLARKAAKVVEVNAGSAGSYSGTALSTGSQTVGTLPSAVTAGAGARSFVTDATATTFLSVVAGGGTNKVPVVSDGANWLIG